MKPEQVINQDPEIHGGVPVFTGVSRQGWKGTRNSELLGQAAAMFDVLVTNDKIISEEPEHLKWTEIITQ